MKKKLFLLAFVVTTIAFALNACSDPVPTTSTVMTINFVTPSGNVTINSNSYLVSGTAMDTHGVYKIFISVNGTDFKETKGNTNWQTNLTGLTDGTYSIRIYGVNGNLAYSQTNVAEFTVKDASGWTYVGTAGFSAAAVDSESGQIVLDKNNTPYICYNDSDNGIIVMKYNGSSWVKVGGSCSGYLMYGSDIALDSSGTVYSFFSDVDHYNYGTVKKYDGSSWVAVGSENIGSGSGAPSYNKIEISPSGAPYIAYSDGENGGRMTVRKYNGSSWTIVGSAGFSAGNSTYIDIAFAANGTPFVSYADMGNGDKISVMKYNGSSWVQVGAAGFSATYMTRNSIAVDPAGTPYVSYFDYANTKGAIVMKFDGSAWVNVGKADFSPGGASRVRIAIDGSGVPYSAFIDEANSGKASVMKYNGSAWVNVGSAGFSPQGASSMEMAIDKSGRPYVCFADGAQMGKASVMKYIGPINSGNPSYVFFNYPLVDSVIDTNSFKVEGFASDEDGIAQVYFQLNSGGFRPVNGTTNWSTNLYYLVGGTNVLKVYTKDSLGNYSGTNTVKLIVKTWVLLGTPGFSAGLANSPKIALDRNSTPYVAYTDNANSFKATVMKYNGSAWVNVGSAGFSAGAVGSICISINSSGTPYVAYRDCGNGSNITVMRYDGSSWVNVGSAGFGAGKAEYVSLALSSSDVPYVAYSDQANGDKATVQKFNGSSWELVGTAGFTTNIAYYTFIALNSSGTPYIIYQNKECNNRAEVSKFNGSIWEVVGDGPISIGKAPYTEIAFNTSGVLYAIFSDATNVSEPLNIYPTVRKYTGSIWTNVGTVGFSGHVGYYTSIVIGTNDIPYTFFTSVSGGYKGLGGMFRHSDWWCMGGDYATSGTANYPDLAIDPITCIPYIVYSDVDNSYKATVKVFK